MAKPILLFSNEAPSASYDATALTGGAAGGQSLVGTTGADWCLFSSTSSPRMKLEGQRQLVPTKLGAGSTFGFNLLNSISWNPNDEIGGGTDSPQSGVQCINCFASGDGARYSSIQADQQLRVFHWAGKHSADGALGTFVVTATFGDGSVAPVSYVLQNIQTPQQFSLAFTSKDACALQIDVVCTSGASGGNPQFLWPQFTWLEVPVPAKLPRFFSSQFMRRNG
jgi:hypothetical protein